MAHDVKWHLITTSITVSVVGFILIANLCRLLFFSTPCNVVGGLCFLPVHA